MDINWLDGSLAGNRAKKVELSNDTLRITFLLTAGKNNNFIGLCSFLFYTFLRFL